MREREGEREEDTGQHSFSVPNTNNGRGAVATATEENNKRR